MDASSKKTIRRVEPRSAEDTQFRTGETRYRVIFESVLDALFISTHDSVIVEANPAACQLYGYPYEEFVGLETPALLHPDDLRVWSDAMAAVSAGGDFRGVARCLRKDGSVIRVEGLSTPFLYEGETHFLSIVRDMTERFEAEEELAEREQQYRSIFEASLDGILLADLDGVIVEANAAACEMYGYSHGELVGLPGEQTLHPDHGHLVRGALSAVQEGKSYANAAVAVRKDGSPFYVDGRTVPLRNRGQLHVMAVIRDITEQVLTAQQLRDQSDRLKEREEQYRSIFESTLDALFISDRDEFIVEANPAACRMFGYTYEEFVGLRTSDLLHPSDRHLVAESMDAVISGETFAGQARCLRKDATMIHVEGLATPFTFKGETHFLTINRDVTERVHADEQMKERQEQYRNIFESSVDGILIGDLNGYIAEASPAACQMYGYTRDEIIGLHGSVLLHPDSLDVMQEALKTVTRGKSIRRQTIAVRKDGTPFYVEGPSSPFTFRNHPHIMSVVRDVTARVEAEQQFRVQAEQLREKEEQYRSIFEATGEALIIAGPDGVIVEANPAACQIYGYSREELIGMHSDEITHPRYRAEILVAAERTADGGVYDTRAISMRKDGTPFHVDARAAGFMYKGEPHVLGVMRDVTELVRAQEDLEQRVEDRTRELSTLLDVSRNVTSTLQLQPLLGVILDQLKNVTPYGGAAIFHVQGEQLVVLVRRASGPDQDAGPAHYRLADMAPLWNLLQDGRPIIIDDVRGGTLLARAYQSTVGQHLHRSFAYERSLLLVPMVSRDRVIGILALSSNQPNHFTPHHADLAFAIGQQSAVAIENAQLFGRAQEVAVAEERQRLSRELHDSVSQALYSIALGAKTARALLERDPTTVAEPLDFVLAQAERGLAEMRALIFELRPEALEQDGLVVVLRTHINAVRARHQITMEVHLEEEPEAPLPVKEALYRIAQEALQNIVKHARASQVVITLTSTTDEIVFEVRDNGAGFNPRGAFPGHLGLSSMRERIEVVGGQLEIESALGTGTVIRTRIPKSVLAITEAL